ncbi:nitrilase [Alkalihalobacillus pseudalcaliphilus]|nr:nitrilase [Alkalihalobacillus pseudalcaliphilus]
MEVIPANPQANRERVEKWVVDELNKNEKPDILVLPEMWTTGYRLEALKEIADTPNGVTYQFLSRLAKSYGVHIIGGSIAVKEGSDIYNRSLVFNREGELVYQYDKVHLVPMLNEPAYLSAGQKKGQVFTLDGNKMGLIICYDLRFPELSRSLALQGVQVLFIVAQWPEVRFKHWNILQQSRAIENQHYVVSCNGIGEDQGTIFAGRSKVIDPWGNILVEGTANKEQTLSSQIDLEKVVKIRNDVPVFESRVPHLY